MAAAFGMSLATGRYPIEWKTALDAGTMNGRVFLTLRLPRSLMALVTGFALSAAGSVYQSVFRNPLVAPDVIGAASGASARLGTRQRNSASSAAASSSLPPVRLMNRNKNLISSGSLCAK